LETKLASERQGRLNVSEKLDLANKVSPGSVAKSRAKPDHRMPDSMKEMQVFSEIVSKSWSPSLPRPNKSDSSYSDSLNNSVKNAASYYYACSRMSIGSWERR
jgi:hypothetical protein